VSGGKIVGGVAAGVAVGTVLGFYVLAPNVEGGPAGTDQSTTSELDTVRDELDAANAGLEADDAVLDSAAAGMVRDVLKDRSVLVVTLPDADPAVVDAQEKLLRAAGAADGGTLRLTRAAVSQDSADAVKTLATSTLPAGARLSEDRRDPGYHLGQVAGQALGSSADGESQASPSDRDLFLGAMSDGGYLDGELSGTGPADAVLVIAGDDTGYAGTFAADLAAGFDATTGGTVLAGDRGAAAEGGALSVLRGNRGDTEAVSSVDNADRVAGRITVVRALAAQLDGRAGSYGTAESAAAPAL